MRGGKEGEGGGLVPLLPMIPSGHAAINPHFLWSVHRASISSLCFPLAVDVQRDASRRLKAILEPDLHLSPGAILPAQESCSHLPFMDMHLAPRFTLCSTCQAG